MTLSTNLDWYIRSTATGTNSGGFDDSVSSPGTNWADADSSQANGTNLTVDSMVNTIVTPDGHTPTSADNGNVVVVTSTSGGWTAGYYTIISNNGADWTLDRSPAATSVASGAWTVGGAFVDGVPLKLDSVSATITSPLAAGHQVNVRGDGSDDPSTVHVQSSADYATPANGTDVNPIRIVGYNGRAHWKSGAGKTLMFYNNTHYYIENMKFTINGTHYSSLGMLYINRSAIHNCIFDANGHAATAVRARQVTDCEFRNSGSKTPSGTTNPAILNSDWGARVEGCTFIDLVQPVWKTSGTTYQNHTTFINNFIIRNYNTVAAMTVYGIDGPVNLVAGNTFHDCEGDAIRCNGDYAIGSTIRNNVFTIAGGYFINQVTSANLNPNVNDYNTFGAGTMGATSGPYNNYSGGDSDVTMASDLDPYTDKAGSDFSLDDTTGTNAKANAFPGSIRGLSTTSYKDRGAAQREEAGGGGSPRLINGGLVS